MEHQAAVSNDIANTFALHGQDPWLRAFVTSYLNGDVLYRRSALGIYPSMRWDPGVPLGPQLTVDLSFIRTPAAKDEPTSLQRRQGRQRRHIHMLAAPGHPTVTVVLDALVVEPTGLAKMWSLTSRIVIPLDDVRGATHDPGIKNAPKGWRGPGLHLGDKLAGTFHADGDR